MVDKYVIRDVTEDLTFFTSLTNAFEVDEKGFWTFDNKPFVYAVDKEDKGRNIVLFQDPLPTGDHYIFNPLSEGLGKSSPAVQLYYRTIRIALNVNVRAATMLVIKYITALKRKVEADEEHSLSHVLMRMSSLPVDTKSTIYDNVDDKTAGEIEKIFSQADDNLITVPYMSQQLSAHARIEALIDPQWEERFGKEIRKKTIATFKSLIMAVLGITSPAELSQFVTKYDPESKSAARFHTTLAVYLKLYSRFNEILPPEQMVDLGMLAEKIDRIPYAYAIAKHMVQAVPPRLAPTDPGAADTSQLRMGGGTDGGKRHFAGPKILGGTGDGFNLAQPQSQGRFKTPLLNEGRVDPFAPVVGSSGFGGGMGGMSPMGGMSMSGGGGMGAFGAGGGGMFGGGMGGGLSLDLNPPSNFAMPGSRPFSF
jgi:hypothetical protein